MIKHVQNNIKQKYTHFDPALGDIVWTTENTLTHATLGPLELNKWVEA